MILKLGMLHWGHKLHNVYICQTHVSVYRTIGPLVFTSMHMQRFFPAGIKECSVVIEKAVLTRDHFSKYQSFLRPAMHLLVY